MAIDRDRISSNLRLNLDNNPRISGLRKFRRDMEREYFSRVKVRNCTPDLNHISLVIEMDCPFNLREMSTHLKEGRWARTHRDPFTGLPISPLDNALFELQLLNEPLLDVEEFSIFLNDCSIIVKKIYQHSIQEQLADIFEAISLHIDKLTSNFQHIPYEIYVPVFEEDLIENDINIANIEQANNEKKDYFKYWGLYFDNQEEAVIYELTKKRIISGELHMLNH